MDIKQLRSLAKIMEDTGLSVLEVTEGDLKIHFERPTADSVPMILPAVAPAAASAVPAAAPAASAEAPGTPPGGFNNITEVKSPMVGVFYDSPSPDSEPYVKVGSRVKKGDVLCIIEAMKLMNEITAQVDGEIVDVCAQNGQVVEYNQPLFKIF